MIKAKILCKCKKQVAFMEEFLFNPTMQDKEFAEMKEQGYEVVIGEDLDQSEFALNPCTGEPGCAFAKAFETSFGFHDIVKR